MTRSEIKKFIDLLTQKTKSNILSWIKCTDTQLFSTYHEYDLSNSYYMEYKSGMIILFSRKDQYLDELMEYVLEDKLFIAIKTSKNSKPELINDPNDFQTELTELRLYMYKQNPNVKDFINSFMSSFS